MTVLKKFVPAPVRGWLRGLRRTARRQQLEAGRHISRAELTAQLRSLGLATGDTVIVHSALSKVGFVDGGPQTVIDALFETVGPRGTLVFPTFPFDTYVAVYLAEHPDFDAVATPSRMGRITEVFRLRPGALRSLHPTHPVSAEGPGAEFLTAAHHLGRTTFGAESPFYRLAQTGGKILMLGVDLHSMTNLHVVEDMIADFPYRVYLPKTISATVRDSQGTVHGMEIRVHDPELSRLRDCNRMEAPFAERGVLRSGTVGLAPARLMDAGGVLTAMTELARSGFTMYADSQVPEEERRSAGGTQV